jgi:hypothetical protein
MSVWSRPEHVHRLETVSTHWEVLNVFVLEDSNWIQLEHFVQMQMNALMTLNAHMDMAAR